METPAGAKGAGRKHDREQAGVAGPEPAPLAPGRRGILGRLHGTLGWLGSQAAEGVAAAGQQGENTNLGGYFGPAQFQNCGVCGSRIARGAQVCPYCQRQPDCRIT